MLEKSFIKNKVYAILSKVHSEADQEKLEEFLTGLFADVITVNNKFTSPSGGVWPNFETFVMRCYCISQDTWLWDRIGKEMGNFLLVAKETSTMYPLMEEVEQHISSYLRRIFSEIVGVDSGASASYLPIFMKESLGKVRWKYIAEAFTTELGQFNAEGRVVSVKDGTDPHYRSRAISLFLPDDDMGLYNSLCSGFIVSPCLIMGNKV
jgi:hypothetical protein